MGVRRWKWIRGYKGLYRVSDDGKVKSVRRWIKTRGNGRREILGKVLTPGLSENGYLIVTLYRNNTRSVRLVHRLVAQAFIPNPNNKPEVNHLDNNKQNNRHLNLEWVTEKENQRKAIESGIRKTGSEWNKLFKWRNRHGCAQ